MLPGDIFKAVAQMADPRFRRVLLTGLALTLGLLVGAYALVLALLDWVLPEQMVLPFVGEITWVDDLLSGASILVMLVLSVFLMIPVASAFTSLFLDDVTDAVEARHYPQLTPAPRLSLGAGLRDAGRFMIVLVLANIVAFIAYLMMPPAAPLIFLTLNGYLLGREYFQLIAARRLGPAGAKAMRRRHAPRIWLAGAAMALPLLLPVVNLLVPILGAATFTHLYHRLSRSEGPSAGTSRDRAHPRRPTG